MKSMVVEKFRRTCLAASAIAAGMAFLNVTPAVAGNLFGVELEVIGSANSTPNTKSIAGVTGKVVAFSVSGETNSVWSLKTLSGQGLSFDSTTIGTSGVATNWGEARYVAASNYYMWKDVITLSAHHAQASNKVIRARFLLER